MKGGLFAGLCTFRYPQRVSPLVWRYRNEYGVGRADACPCGAGVGGHASEGEGDPVPLAHCARVCLAQLLERRGPCDLLRCEPAGASVQLASDQLPHPADKQPDVAAASLPRRVIPTTCCPAGGTWPDNKQPNP